MNRLSKVDNVVWQEPGQPVSALVRPASPPVTHLALHHAINLHTPTTDEPGSVQAATTESMIRAKGYALSTVPTMSVSLLAVQLEREAGLLPPGFASCHHLRRTIRDLPDFRDGRPLPLLFDILVCVAGSTQSGYVIFTNSDICIQPSFYLFVQSALCAGFDSLVINRRTISADARHVPHEVACAEIGTDHPGLDCFVFPARWLVDFQRNDACVGAGLVMRGLFYNLVALADRLLVLTEPQLTFHFGDDRPWQSDANRRYMEHNRQQGRIAYDLLCKKSLHQARLEKFHQRRPEYRPTTL